MEAGEETPPNPPPPASVQRLRFFLLPTQCNKVPLAVYCGVVNARGGGGGGAESRRRLQRDSFPVVPKQAL